MVNNDMHLRDVVRDMRRLDMGGRPVPFCVVVRSFDRQNGKGGRLVEYIGARLMQGGGRRSLASLASGGVRRNPNHWENKTRNIKTGGRICKVNILFIVSYNGFNVVY